MAPGGAGSELRRTGEDLRQEAGSLAQDLKREGQGVAEAAAERARSFADQQREAGAGQADTIARAVHGAARELDDTSPEVAHYVHDAAAAVDGFARTLRERSPGELMGQVEDLARRQPVAFFGATVLAGFALARFARSSADDGQRLADRSQGATAWRAPDDAPPLPGNAASPAPGWVPADEATPLRRPATMAAATLGGAAAHQAREAGAPGVTPDRS
jgi:hypothetical protein